MGGEILPRKGANLRKQVMEDLALGTCFDVIIVGSGAAGLYAALCLPSHLKIALVTKAQLKTGASDWAQGGIAAAIAPTDSPQFHLTDTLRAGAGLCEAKAVEFLVEKAPKAIEDLVRRGVQFDRSGPDLALTLEAAHSQARVLHAADRTGRAIVSILREQVQNLPQVQIFSQAVALKLAMESGHCRGLCVLYEGQIQWFQARVVLLATGGGGQVYAQTTNPPVSTGDGVALAWRAGALLRDLEFFQFHPTALTKPPAPHFLISEAVRGEGAHLLDKQGDRFAFRYHPQGELAPRDVVSRAIFQHLEATESQPAEATVFLDLSPIPPERIQYRFPNIIERCRQWGIDVFSEPIPVAPAAHYWMGGIVTDLHCQTSIPGLLAIGEVASTGVHGANRLASNSLLECIVFAEQLATPTLPPIIQRWAALSANGSWPWQEEIPLLNQLRRSLPALMWHSAGICRTQSTLTTAIAQVHNWREQWAQSATSRKIERLQPGENVFLPEEVQCHHLQQWAEMNNLLDIAQLILKSALFRPESRGGHYRLDYPQPNPHWQLHTLVVGERWQTGAVDGSVA